MTRYVIDASAAVEYLLRTTTGRHVADLIQGADILAPMLIDVEVLSALRRLTLAGILAVDRADEAIADLSQWPIQRTEHTALLHEAWGLRNNVNAYDALYVAAARLYEAVLLTADGPLARMPVQGITVHNISSPE